jgi:hypothetical protein
MTMSLTATPCERIAAARFEDLPAETMSASQSGGKVVAWWFPKREVAATDELIEVTVENACSGHWA